MRTHRDGQGLQFIRRSGNAVGWFTRGVWVLVGSAIAFGCAARSPGGDTTRDESARQLPAYREVARRYNERLDGLDRIWARAVVELRWRDERGRHVEQGDGHLLAVRPSSVALSIGKLGHTLLWAGGDGDRHWLFDLRDEAVVYVGNSVGDEESDPFDGAGLSVPLRPGSLLQVLGLMPIDEQREPAPPGVEWHRGRYLIEPPGAGCRILIDPETWRAVRIDLVDSAGNTHVEARLSRYGPVVIDGRSPGGYPAMATRLEVRLVGQDGWMAMYLSGLSDGRAGHKIQDRAFDLASLARAFKPVRWVGPESGE